MNCGLKGALHSQLGLFLLLQQFFLFLKGFPVFVKTVVHRFTTAATIANALAADALALGLLTIRRESILRTWWWGFPVSTCLLPPCSCFEKRLHSFERE